MDQLRRMTVAEFKGLSLADSIPVSLDLRDMCFEVVAGRKDDDVVFCNTSGRAYSIKDLTEMLKRAHKIAGISYNGMENFIDLVN